MSNVSKSHDKGYKKILSKKRNFLNFLKFFVGEEWTKKLTEDSLELSDKEFILTDYQRNESDLIYKAKIEDKDIYFYVLIEFQSSNDFTMPFRLLRYMSELMDRIFLDTDPKERERRDFKLPAIVPIILHNGSDNWTAQKNFKDYQSGADMFGNHIINFEYILININSIEDSELDKIENIISYIFTFDKKQNIEKFMNNLKAKAKTFQSLTPDEQVDFIDWLKITVQNKYSGNKSEIDKIVEYFKIGADEKMTYAIERLFDEVEEKGIQKGREEGIQKGREEGILSVAKKMIEKGIEINEIAELTGLSMEEIEKLKE